MAFPLFQLQHLRLHALGVAGCAVHRNQAACLLAGERFGGEAVQIDEEMLGDELSIKIGGGEMAMESSLAR